MKASSMIAEGDVFRVSAARARRREFATATARPLERFLSAKGRLLRAVLLGLPLAVLPLDPSLAETTAGRRAEVKALVAREARALGVPVSLALAVAHVESNFNPRALSPAGARGVMQVMPATAMGEYGIPKDRLWDARVNVRVGLHFLKRLLKQFRGRTDLALSWYNGGSGVGTGWRARVLPATRDYVRRVKRLQRRYRVEEWVRTPPRSGRDARY